jgi:hypothetical protein
MRFSLLALRHHLVDQVYRVGQTSVEVSWQLYLLVFNSELSLKNVVKAVLRAERLVKLQISELVEED